MSHYFINALCIIFVASKQASILNSFNGLGMEHSVGPIKHIEAT